MSNIKIFVSHRRDTISSIIKNPLYINVVCGQALAEVQKGKIGDNTGDNISEKAPYYSEYTVQYWAWKNVKADYYGLCHYRRYLNFSDCPLPAQNPQGMIVSNKLTPKECKKYNLLSCSKMKKEIEKYDIITSETFDVSNLDNTPKFITVYDAIVNSPALFTRPDTIDKLKNIVFLKFPQYYELLLDELNSRMHRGFNCFIMKKELFDAMCNFEFTTLFSLEKMLDLKNRVGFYERELGYIGEILYGTFMRWAFNKKKYRIKTTKIVLFLNTEKKQLSFKKDIFEKVKNVVRPNYNKIKKMKNELQCIQQGIFSMNRLLMDATINMNKTISMFNKGLLTTIWKSYNSADEALLAFWKAFPKATGDLRTIQKAQTILLKDFKRICQKQNCEFWLHGGSLVGGLRHSGFVPWDDDIDIAMMREDFLKVKAYLFENSRYYTIRNYYYQNLGCRSYRFQRNDMDSNCFLDIFIYDNYSLRYGSLLTDWKYLCHQKKRILQQIKNIEQSFGINPPPNDTLEQYSEFRKKLDILYDMYISYNTSGKESEYILWNQDNNYENETRYAWHHGRIFKKEDIFPFKRVVFEGIECNIPSNYEKYSFAEYGIRYLDTPQNFAQSVHFNYYFGKDGQIELAQEIINEGALVED